MNKKLIIFEILGALVVAVLFNIVFYIIAATIGGNYMTDFTFMGRRGYEATGMLGVIFGLLLGGMLGAYVVRRRFTTAEQKISSAIGIGLLAGIILLSIVFVRL